MMRVLKIETKNGLEIYGNEHEAMCCNKRVSDAYSIALDGENQFDIEGLKGVEIVDIESLTTEQLEAAHDFDEEGTVWWSSESKQTYNKWIKESVQ